MRRCALLLFAGVPSLLGAQGFGVYEHNACTMARGGVAAASPCADGSAIFFNPAGLAGLSGNHLSGGITIIAATGNFTEDIIGTHSDIDPQKIPVPNAFITHAFSPKLTVGFGFYVPYGLEVKWPSTSLGRFIGYDTKVKALYFQPTVGYQVTPKIKLGLGVAYIHSTVELHQHADLSAQPVAPGITFGMLGIPTNTDFVDAALTGSGNGIALNGGIIWQVTDRLAIGGHFLTKKTIGYDGAATFKQIPTGLVLPVGNPIAPGTPVPVDGLVAPNFLPLGPLSNGAVSTALVMPDQGSIGFSYKVTNDWSLMADYQQVVWGWFQSLTFDFHRFANDTQSDITLNPHNKDSNGFRFGTEYKLAKATLRAGYLYHTAASPDEFVTPLLPEGPRNEFTAGVGFTVTGLLHGDLAYQHIIQNDRRGTINFATGNNGLYTFKANLFGAGFSYSF